jgi:hypothetical protein
MNISTVRNGDLVLVDKRGVRFHAYVQECHPGELRVRAIERNTTWRAASAREVVAHWRKSKASRV